MQFSRQMIALVQQIRRPAQVELGEHVLLADPLLFETLGRIVSRTENADIRQTIAEFFRLAGEAVPSVPSPSTFDGDSDGDGDGDAATATVTPRKVYRGCVIG